MVLSGFLASQSVFDLRVVVLIGAVGGFIGDQLFFWIGRLSNKASLLKKLDRNVKYRKARRIVRKYGSYIILVSRYLVGMRMALSFALGAMRVPCLRFSLMNFISAMIWAPSVALLGYAMGSVALKVLGDIKRYETALILAALVVALIAFLIKRYLENVEERRLP
ncbi:DedA family protein [Thermosulfidibacter takaii]